MKFSSGAIKRPPIDLYDDENSDVIVPNNQHVPETAPKPPKDQPKPTTSKHGEGIVKENKHQDEAKAGHMDTKSTQNPSDNQKTTSKPATDQVPSTKVSNSHDQAIQK